MTASTERSKELRKRRKEAGEEEIRGVWAPKSKHAEIKRQIREIIKNGKN